MVIYLPRAYLTPSIVCEKARVNYSSLTSFLYSILVIVFSLGLNTCLNRVSNYSKSFEYSYSNEIWWLCDNLNFVSRLLDIGISRTFWLVSKRFASYRRRLEICDYGSVTRRCPNTSRSGRPSSSRSCPGSSWSSSSSSSSSWGEFVFSRFFFRFLASFVSPPSFWSSFVVLTLVLALLPLRLPDSLWVLFAFECFFYQLGLCFRVLWEFAVPAGLLKGIFCACGLI